MTTWLEYTADDDSPIKRQCIQRLRQRGWTEDGIAANFGELGPFVLPGLPDEPEATGHCAPVLRRRRKRVCCKGGQLKPECKLCPQSPTYWRTALTATARCARPGGRAGVTISPALPLSFLFRNVTDQLAVYHYTCHLTALPLEQPHDHQH
jgi:hypothetical protein